MENNGLVVKIKVREKFLLHYLKDFYWDLYFSLTLSQKSGFFNEMQFQWKVQATYLGVTVRGLEYHT